MSLVTWQEEALDNFFDTARFFGTLYINSTPQIISVPPDYLILGDTLIYQIEVYL